MNEITFSKDITDRSEETNWRGREFELKVMKTLEGRQVVSVCEITASIIWFSTVLDSNAELHIHLTVKGGE